jgi:hypothetical protein
LRARLSVAEPSLFVLSIRHAASFVVIATVIFPG